MKISFLDFWGDFNPNNNFLINSIRQIKEFVEVTTPEDSDIIICSIFGQEHHKYYNSKKIILFSGENIRPNYQTYDKSISFDFDSYENRNIRIPLWYYYIDWFDVKSYGNPEYLIPVDYLYNENEFSKKEKNKFCCTVFSASHYSRFQMMNTLNTYKNVDGYGKVHNNRIPDGGKVKMDIISDYKFSICFENSIYPGYFTEKLLHAKIAGTIPIYNSHGTMNEDFNKDCCLNLNISSFQEILELVKEIDSNDKLYKSYIEQPLFTNKIEISNILEKINNII